MWRIVLGATLLLTLALGSVAAACPWCGAQTALEGVKIEATDSASVLVLTVRPLAADLALPDSATAVVMFFNGNRAKCLNSPLRKANVDSSGLATYRGNIPNYFGGAQGQTMTYTGRAEVAGDVYEFTASTDGKPGTAKIVTDGTTVNAVAATPAATQTVVTPVPIATAAATLAPAAAQAPQPATDPWTPVRQPMTWLAALAILATIAGAYVDRRRALARATA
jgi:hypothetical protein